MPLPNYSPERRREVAQAAKISEAYLYQILTGKSSSQAKPALARRLNAIDPELRLQDLRPDDWRDIWPELVVGTDIGQCAIKSKAWPPPSQAANQPAAAVAGQGVAHG